MAFEKKRKELRERSAEIRRNPQSVTDSELVEQFEHMAFAAARYYVDLDSRTYLSVEDVQQEILMHLLKVWPKYDPERGAPSTWARRVLRSEAARVVRRSTWQKEGKSRDDRHLQTRESLEESTVGASDPAESYSELPVGLSKHERFAALALAQGYTKVEVKELLSQVKDATAIEAIFAGLEAACD